MNTPLFSIQNISKIFPGVSETREEIKSTVSANAAATAKVATAAKVAAFSAIKDLSLDIYAGQCLMIAGSNGSGKTLLMRIIAGLLEPSGGNVLFRGQPLYSAKAASQSAQRRETGGNVSCQRRLRRELGLVFQDADAQIVGETVAEDVAFGPENLGFSAEEVKASGERALAAMGLAEKRLFSPRRLSGGEKRRLAIAGILAMGCGIVIMDEPFANLDWPGVVQTLSVIRDLKDSGKTLVILTHELEKALALADRLVILHRGSLCADGPPAKVLDGLDPNWGVRDPRRNYATVEDCSWLE
jgi:biotin transport system ATP-binding protein